MLLKIGDKVRFLHEVGSGIVLKINGKTSLIEDEHGFEINYPTHLLVPKMEVNDSVLLSKVLGQDKIANKAVKSKSVTKKKGELEWKIDLHMENLTDSHQNMSNHEIVTYQLEKLKAFLKNAENAKIGRLIVVHGVGTGKLKEEIKMLVQGMNGTEMFDADYMKYGRGASIIDRRYNIR